MSVFSNNHVQGKPVMSELHRLPVGAAPGKVTFVDLVLRPMGSYEDLYHMPFVPNTDGSALEVVSDFTNRVYDASKGAGMTHSALVGGSLVNKLRRDITNAGFVGYGIEKSRPIYISGGWARRRMSFTLIVDVVSSNVNSIATRYEYTGYSDVYDPTHTGLIGPDTVFFFNTVTTYSLANKNGGVGLVHNNTASIVTNPANGAVNSGLASQAFALRSITPFGLMNHVNDLTASTNHVDVAAANVFDALDLAKNGDAVDRKTDVAANFATEILTGMVSALGSESSAPTINWDHAAEAMSKPQDLKDTPLFKSIRSLMAQSGFPSIGRSDVAFKTLCDVLPEIVLAGKNRIPEQFRNGNAYQRGTFDNSWLANTMHSTVAKSFQAGITAAMHRYGIRLVGYTAYNAQGAHHFVGTRFGTMFAQGSAEELGAIHSFIHEMQTQVLPGCVGPGVTYQIGGDLYGHDAPLGQPASADLSGQLSFVLSLPDLGHNSRLQPFCVPMFADACFSSQLSTNQAATHEWVRKMSDIGLVMTNRHNEYSGIVNSSQVHYTGPAPGSMPWQNDMIIPHQHVGGFPQQVTQPIAMPAPTGQGLRFGI